MKLSENPDEIVIRHAPVGRWVAGWVAGFVFGAFCLSALLFPDLVKLRTLFAASQDDSWAIPALIAFGAAVVLLAVLAVGFVSLILTPLTTVRVDQKTGCVEITRRRIYGSRTERFYFHQVQKFKSRKAKLNFSSRYLLSLVLANRKTVKLKIPVAADQKEAVRLVKKLNRFIKPERRRESRIAGA